jgi:hypothetical protein
MRRAFAEAYIIRGVGSLARRSLLRVAADFSDRSMAGCFATKLN